MKTHRFSLIIAAIALGVLPLMAQQNRTSPHETLSTVIGDRRTGCRVTITYGRPYAKDPRSATVRKIWGTTEEKALVPNGRAWRMGADEATLLITQQPLVIGETTIPAGAYTLYMIPADSGASKLAFSTRLGQWGVPVDEKSDLARVDLKKEPLEKTADQFTMAIDKNAAGDGGVIKLMWENTQFSVPFTVKK